MRASVFVLAVLSIFGILAYTVWLESAIVAEAYVIFELREEEAEMRNQIRIRTADLAARNRAAVLKLTAEEMGLTDLERNVAKVVANPGTKNAARGAD
ncbi:MAG: hypothetical protein ACI97A_004388 [Planctomycetota bacterium]|jgi:hypothetical protein